MEHYVYSLEILVKTLTVTKANECAPKEYPCHAEFRLRQDLFVSIPYYHFGSFVDKTEDKSSRNDNQDDKMLMKPTGRCCIFTLEQPIDVADVLDVRIYKKKGEMCKFLVGMAEIPIKKHFDNVMVLFAEQNKDGSGKRALLPPVLPRPPHSGGQSTSPLTPYSPDTDSDPTEGPKEAEIEERKTKKAPEEDETMFSTRPRKDTFGIHTDKSPFKPDKSAYVLINELLPLKNEQGEATGFLSTLLRLSCLGQSICNNIPYPGPGAGNNDRRSS